ncbi:hypothetical protein [uncultured Tyzzerella sp.]|uniref:hypothetical protein n=1 Tax=uncultured Tyzzerella sp. TaxID=2321398 RepID=UPI0029437EDF|nr:hypothetical protein [uncultured Tyzzerella sp.]
MAGKELTLEDFMTFIDTLPYNDFRKIVECYLKNTGSDFKNDMEVITTIDFEKRLQN